MPNDRGPRWAKPVLLAAAVYNLAFGAAAMLAPMAWFELAGLRPPDLPALWQCIGMIVGVYGVGYAIAAFAALRHWPIVLVGLLGKVLGPIGFVDAAVRGELPWRCGWLIVTNDLIWWLPFALLLRAAWHHHRR
ncbi:MAG: alkyl hydroperoxide reductase [Planctomycetes bacterium]|nr:alkyl hydroperoxide reductase [Planctomycetota bacterium]